MYFAIQSLCSKISNIAIHANKRQPLKQKYLQKLLCCILSLSPHHFSLFFSSLPLLPFLFSPPSSLNDSFIVINAIDGDEGYNSIMSDTPLKVQTRGRPRKNTEERLPPISRKLFSQHCAVFYACCMVYVLEVFLKTKTEKRIGHSEGGFTLYEKINPAYCFDTLEEDLKEWGYGQMVNAHPGLLDFLKTVNGCAPRFVFKELVTLVVGLAEALLKEDVTVSEQLDLNEVPFLCLHETQLNRKFKYLRFSPAALRELKMDKWSAEVSRKIRDLWQPFLKIVAYTVLGVLRGSEKSKFLKPFFSDAEHPEDTIIGQLNLQQIVEQREREERPSPSPPPQGFTKILKTQGQERRQDERRLEFNSLQGLVPDRPLLNRRLITLITFPSNPHISPPGSPFKNRTVVSNSEEKEEQVEQIDPTKKLKIE